MVLMVVYSHIQLRGRAKNHQPVSFLRITSHHLPKMPQVPPWALESDERPATGHGYDGLRKSAFSCYDVWGSTTTGWWFGTMEFCDFPYVGNVIIPTDEVIFFRGVGRKTTYQK